MSFSPSGQGLGELRLNSPLSLLLLWFWSLLAVSSGHPAGLWALPFARKERMKIKFGSLCPPVVGSAFRAYLGVSEGKDLMSPHVPSVGLFPPFLLTAPLSARIRIFFFFLPLEENSIVLFLVVTTWLLPTTFILLLVLPAGTVEGEWLGMAL